MGDDDRNEGAGPGECPGHEWRFEQAVLSKPSRWGLRGLSLVESCRWCGAIKFEPSAFERD